MKKKWFRTMDLVDEKYMEEANPENRVISLQRKRRITTLVASAACLVLTLTSLWLFLPYEVTQPGIDAYKKDDYYAVIEKLNALKKAEREHNNRFESIIDEVDDMFLAGSKGDAAANEAAPSAPVRGNGNYEEITDNQVEGITEADRIKRSSTHIYYLDQNTLKIFTIAGAESTQVGKVDLPSGNDKYYVNQWEFYLSADCKTATVLTQYLNDAMQLCVGIVSVDVSDPTNPVQKGVVEITGSYLSSRLTGGKLLLMTNFTVNKKTMDFDKPETFLPQINGQNMPADCIVLPENVNTARYTVVLKLDESTLDIEGQSAFLSYTEDVYVSNDHIFLTHVYADTVKDGEYAIRNSMTEISCLTYGGSFENKGSVVVRGYVKDQWSMDEYENVLRVVTTTNATQIQEKYAGGYVSAEIAVTATGKSNASLYCVDLESFKVVAGVEDFAPPYEEVRSVRFDKTTAYVCTAIEVSDPVYFFDLSDLSNITYKETGTIEGFSTSLINMGNGYLLGIGQENWNTLKIEVYQETGAGVEGICKYVAENAGYSENYKSYYVDRKNQLVGLGIYDYNGSSKATSRYILLRFDGYNLAELVNVDLNGNPGLMRGVYIDGFMYLFGESVFKVVDVQHSQTTITKIVDRAKEEKIPCDTSMELFYEDETNQYYFSCIKSQYIEVTYNTGKTEDVIAALKSGAVKIADLDRFGIEYYTKKK